MASASYSSYFESLEDAKMRYRVKLALLGGISDRYVAFPSSTRYFSKIDKVERVEWLAVKYPGIYNYFVSAPSPVTKEALEAYKSMDAYKYFVDGWVSNVAVQCCSTCNSTFLATVLVKHSQTLCHHSNLRLQ